MHHLVYWVVVPNINTIEIVKSLSDKKSLTGVTKPIHTPETYWSVTKDAFHARLVVFITFVFHKSLCSL